METYEQKKRRLFGKQYLQSYLGELKSILQISVETLDLLPIVETDKLSEIDYSNYLKMSFNILFNEKNKLKEIIFKNCERVNKSYFIFTEYSLDCGTLKISKLQDFNFDFSFKSLHSGLISLISEDLSEKIILDFSEENGDEYLEIEIYKIK
jgi:hypothetical protein